MPATPKPLTSRGWRRYVPQSRREWRRAFAVLGIALLTFLLIAYVLARLTPRWYAPLDGTSIAVLDTGDYVEKVRLRSEIITTLERVGMGDQTWSITQNEMNCFLAVHWQRDAVQSGKPAAISAPMVIFSPGRVIVAARIARLPGSNPAGGVGTIAFSVQSFPRPPGPPHPPPGSHTPRPPPLPLPTPSSPIPPRPLPTLQIKLNGVWIGDLSIPKFLVAGKIRSQVPDLIKVFEDAFSLGFGNSTKIPGVDDIAHAVETEQPFPVRFTFDHRPVVVKEVRVEEGKLTIIFSPATPAAVPPHPPAAIR